MNSLLCEWLTTMLWWSLFWIMSRSTGYLFILRSYTLQGDSCFSLCSWLDLVPCPMPDDTRATDQVTFCYILVLIIVNITALIPCSIKLFINICDKTLSFSPPIQSLFCYPLSTPLSLLFVLFPFIISCIHVFIQVEQLRLVVWFQEVCGINTTKKASPVKPSPNLNHTKASL